MAKNNQKKLKAERNRQYAKQYKKRVLRPGARGGRPGFGPRPAGAAPGSETAEGIAAGAGDE